MSFLFWHYVPDLKNANATPLWCVARCGLDRIDTLIGTHSRVPMQTSPHGSVAGTVAKRVFRNSPYHFLLLGGFGGTFSRGEGGPKGRMWNAGGNLRLRICKGLQVGNLSASLNSFRILRYFPNSSSVFKFTQGFG